MEPSNKPTRKVVAGGAAGALATIICWAASAFGGVEIPAEVAVAITALVTFALQYAIQDREVQS